MDEKEQIAICKAIAEACMWGQGGIASVIIDRLDKKVEAPRKWREVYVENSKAAQRESVGVLDDEDRLRIYLRQGYWLTNYNEDGCALFNPPPMNGLCMYVTKELAEKYKRPDPYTAPAYSGPSLSSLAAALSPSGEK